MTDSAVVTIVEDDDAVRDSLTLLFSLNGFAARAHASAEALLEVADTLAHGCLVVDFRLPGANGLQLLQTLRERGVGLPTVLISGHGDIAAARQAFKLGAVDFLEKPIDDAELLSMVRQAIAQHAVSRDRERERRALQERLASLTERERQIFDRVALGMHAREIGAELAISPRTVEVHRARVMLKLGTRRVAELVRIREQLQPDT